MSGGSINAVCQHYYHLKADPLQLLHMQNQPSFQHALATKKGFHNTSGCIVNVKTRLLNTLQSSLPFSPLTLRPPKPNIQNARPKKFNCQHIIHAKDSQFNPPGTFPEPLQQQMDVSGWFVGKNCNSLPKTWTRYTRYQNCKLPSRGSDAVPKKQMVHHPFKTLNKNLASPKRRIFQHLREKQIAKTDEWG